MSFAFKWPQFSQDFYRDATQTLDNALNKGQKPPIIADRINVKELNMGSLPPELEILEIGDLTKDRFRGIFRLTYAGDAYIELQTSVQANPLSNSKPGLDILPSPSVLFAAQPLVVPMSLRLSELKLQAIIVLVISRQKGITLVFKNDPLQSVKVSSSFDSVGVIQGYIQRQIEGQLREVFRSDLPSIIHRLSQRWLTETTPAKAFEPAARIQTQTAFTRNRNSDVPAFTTRSMNPIAAVTDENLSRHHRSASCPRLPSDLAEESVSDALSTYDPTYGMRPDSTPPKRPKVLEQMSELWQSSDRNLGHMFDSNSTSPSSLFESRLPSSSRSSAPSLGHELTPDDAISSKGVPLSDCTPHHQPDTPRPTPQSERGAPVEPRKPSPPPLLTRHSTTPMYRSPLSFDLTEAEEEEQETSFHLNTSRNDACAHIRTLSHSFQTLSPFTRPLEHFTARSVPRGAHVQSKLGSKQQQQVVAEPPARGRRKRHIKLGKAAAAPVARPPSPAPSMTPSSGSDWSDYFPRQPATQLS